MAIATGSDLSGRQRAPKSAGTKLERISTTRSGRLKETPFTRRPPKLKELLIFGSGAQRSKKTDK